MAAGGTLGILIPPSVIFLIYGFLTETSIGKLFLAGVLPGILLTVLFVFTIAIVTWHNPKLAPTVQERASFSDRLKALREVWAVAALFTLVIGGMYGGVFTATEAAGIGAFGTLILALLRGRLTWAHAVALARQHGRDRRHHHGDPGRRGRARLFPGRHPAAHEARRRRWPTPGSPPPASC